MDFAEALDLLSYWRSYPPPHLVLLGYKPEPAREKRRRNTTSGAEAVAAYQALGNDVKVNTVANAPRHIQEAIRQLKRKNGGQR